MADKKYRAIGYVKLAKLWQRSKDSAVAYHEEYFRNRYRDSENISLMQVLVDITGEKEIYKRKAMIRMLSLCKKGEADAIAAQTKAYLAANAKDFFYLLKYISDLPYEIGIITEDEDMPIDTVNNPDGQKKELYRMAEKFVALDRGAYGAWKRKVDLAVAASE